MRLLETFLGKISSNTFMHKCLVPCQLHTATTSMLSAAASCEGVRWHVCSLLMSSVIFTTAMYAYLASADSVPEGHQRRSTGCCWHIYKRR
jgi:hypothetical protein